MNTTEGKVATGEFQDSTASLGDNTENSGQVAGPTVCVVIVAYNSGAYLKRCIAELERQNWRDFKCIIIDNASTDNAVDELGSLPEHFRIVQSRRNLGFAGANNQAVSETNAPWIATLNPDAFPKPDWLSQLMAATRRHPNADMFGSTQLLASDPSRLDGAGDVYHASGIMWRSLIGRKSLQLPSEGETFSPCGAAALWRRRTFCDHGGFDEMFFCFAENVDLAFRIRLAGGHCVQVTDAVVHHVGGGSTSRHSDFAIRHGWPNRLWTFVKNMPSTLFWMLLPLHLGATMILLSIAIIQGRGRPAWLGLAEAVRRIGPVWRARREIQIRRTTRAWRIARVLSWSPLAPFHRAARILPIRG